MQQVAQPKSTNRWTADDIGSSSSSSTSSSTSDDSSDDEDRTSAKFATPQDVTYNSSPEVQRPTQRPSSSIPASRSNSMCAAERVRADSDLLQLWANITDLAEDVIETLALTLPDEHLRALVSQKEQLMQLTPQIMQSLNETLHVTMTESRKSTNHSLENSYASMNSPRQQSDITIRSSSRNSNSGGTPMIGTSKATSSLDIVDNFRDDVQLLVRHHQDALQARITRRRAQLEEVKNTNRVLLAQKQRLQQLTTARDEEEVERNQRTVAVLDHVMAMLPDLEACGTTHFQREAEADRILGEDCSPMEELCNDRSVTTLAPLQLSYTATMVARAATVNHAYLKAMQEESEEARIARWQERLASTYYPDAFTEALEAQIADIAAKRNEYLDAIVPYEEYCNKVVEKENKNKLRKSDRSVSPVRSRALSGAVSPSEPTTARELASTRSPEEAARLLTQVSTPANSQAPQALRIPPVMIPGRQRSKSPSQCSNAAAVSPRLQEPDTARSTQAETSRSIGGRSVTSTSPSRRESAFRSNGMIHVPTSEARCDLLLIPNQATCTTTRTSHGELLPSLKTLLHRRDRLQKELARVQTLAKREMLIQVRLLMEAESEAKRMSQLEKRRRESLAREK